MKRGERIRVKINLSNFNLGTTKLRVLAKIISSHNEFGIENFVLEISKKYDILKLHLKKYQDKYNESLNVEIEKEGRVLKGFLRIENKQFILTNQLVYNFVKVEGISVYIPRRNRRIGSFKVRVHKNIKGFILQAEELFSLPDNIYHIVFRSKFYECKKVDGLIYFTRSNLIK